MPERTTAPCPEPECDGTVRVTTSLPAGTYPCPCKARTLRLSWSTSTDFTRTPALRLEDTHDV